MIYKGFELEEYVGRSSHHFKDLTGMNFGHWYVICRAKTDKKRHSIFWCECLCGCIQKVYSTHLLRGLTNKCIKCVGHNNTKNKNKYGEIPMSFWREFAKKACGEKSRGHRRHIKFSLTIEEAYTQYCKQNKKCALTGLNIGFETSNKLDKNGHVKRWYNTASLDRIDCEGDYEIGNIQWVHKDINIMRNVYSIEYFIDMCKNVVKNQTENR